MARTPEGAKRKYDPVERAKERAKIDTYMSRAEEYDVMNLALADEWLRQRAEIGESDYRIQFALRCMARLRPDIEL